MKIVILNKSDSTGGAAVVSRRLMEALRLEGVDARMLVCEKLTDSPYIELAASPKIIKSRFYLERLKIFIANGFNRSTLFKIDTGEEGLPLWRHPLVKQADAILINWVNQGMLSLKGFEKILQLRKPVIVTMHDMWEMTGICHHAYSCQHYLKECGDCPLLGSKASFSDLSHKIWLRKNVILKEKQLTTGLTFVAVSNWLKDKASQSSLLSSQRVEVIPNAWIFKEETDNGGSNTTKRNKNQDEIRILFGAARLDDPIKGLDTLKTALGLLSKEYPQMGERLKLTVFGNIFNPALLEDFSVKVDNLGVLNGEEAVRKAYESSDILVSASSYETLPGTLVEAQAYGCIPVSFNQGGQADIIDHKTTGYLASYHEDPEQRARNLAEGILWASDLLYKATQYENILEKMRKSVEVKFDYRKIARKYLNLINGT